MKKILRVFLLCLSIIGCDPADNRLTIVNNSDLNMYFILSCDSMSNNSNILKNQTFIDEYNDTTFTESDNFIAMQSSKKVIKVGKNGWENFVKSNCSNEKLYLTFISDSIFNNNSVESILYHKLYLKQFSISLSDLKSNNWIVNVNLN